MVSVKPEDYLDLRVNFERRAFRQHSKSRGIEPVAPENLCANIRLTHNPSTKTIA
jgi:hypothetical protein